MNKYIFYVYPLQYQTTLELYIHVTANRNRVLFK
jgi:hypothetical protein